MTQDEKNQVSAFLNEIFWRINQAKSSIKEMNLGQAYDILNKAYPQLKLKVDE